MSTQSSSSVSARRGLSRKRKHSNISMLWAARTVSFRRKVALPSVYGACCPCTSVYAMHSKMRSLAMTFSGRTQTTTILYCLRMVYARCSSSENKTRCYDPRHHGAIETICQHNALMMTTTCLRWCRSKLATRWLCRWAHTAAAAASSPKRWAMCVGFAAPWRKVLPVRSFKRQYRHRNSGRSWAPPLGWVNFDDPTQRKPDNRRVSAGTWQVFSSNIR